MFGIKKDKNHIIHGELEESYGEALESPDHTFNDTARKYASRAGDAVRTSTDNIKSQIESNPITCVAVAATTAFIIGFLIGRR